jgi:hypothetical protein
VLLIYKKFIFLERAFMLTEKEAVELINVFKILTDNVVDLPHIGNSKELEVIQKYNSKQKFTVYIRRSGRNINKISYHAMDNKTKTSLMRLDIVDKDHAHKNPNGEIIYGPHLHIFKDNFEIKFAKEFNVDNKNLVQSCLTFFKLFNIIDVDQNNVYEELLLLN